MDNGCGGGGGEKSGDFYSVLGLKKECSDAELKNAYKKLAMRWHPDRCSASGNSKFVEEAKEKFQEIQEAYSVLSDSSKRFLYDVGVYDRDDDENAMGDFLGEMAQMMSQTNPSENVYESFEELQQIFVDMFQSDLESGCGGPSSSYKTNNCGRFSVSSSSFSSGNGSTGSNKRNNTVMNSVNTNAGEFVSDLGTFCFGSNDSTSSGKGEGVCNSGKRRNGRKQKVSSKHDVSSRDSEISAA